MAKSAEAFRTISEVAEWLDTPAHVLRFWESRFAQIKPVKRAGGRRYYRPSDMLLLGGLKKLLHEDGLTIKGAQKILREKGIKHVSGLSHPLPVAEDEPAPVAPAPEPLFDDSQPAVEDTDYVDEVDETPPPPSEELTRVVATPASARRTEDEEDDDDDEQGDLISLFAEDPTPASIRPAPAPEPTPVTKPAPPPDDTPPPPRAPLIRRPEPRTGPASTAPRATRLRELYDQLAALRDRMRQPPV